jgi:hypothetical protein
LWPSALAVYSDGGAFEDFPGVYAGLAIGAGEALSGTTSSVFVDARCRATHCGRVVGRRSAAGGGAGSKKESPAEAGQLSNQGENGLMVGTLAV